MSKIGRWFAGIWLRSSLANKYKRVSFVASYRGPLRTYDGAFFQGQLASRVEATPLVQENGVVEEVVVKQILVWEEGPDQKVVAMVAVVVVVVVAVVEQGIVAGIGAVVVV